MKIQLPRFGTARRMVDLETVQLVLENDKRIVHAMQHIGVGSDKNLAQALVSYISGLQKELDTVFKEK